MNRGISSKNKNVLTVIKLCGQDVFFNRYRVEIIYLEIAKVLSWSLIFLGLIGRVFP